MLILYLFVKCVSEISVMSMSSFLMKCVISDLYWFIPFAFQKQIFRKLIFETGGFAASGFMTSTVLALCFAWMPYFRALFDKFDDTTDSKCVCHYLKPSFKR